eukprot:TRINITY_DN5076_c0_g1_i1.p1 TRINITY_DN5076_c0_g1~~TRINITY_DN5076_c0_g1_i1.p1  ORF type:complete len:130 (-),score=4.84 TRINITY_DN5076_c0_g1_i1:114-503(-)
MHDGAKILTSTKVVYAREGKITQHTRRGAHFEFSLLGDSPFQQQEDAGKGVWYSGICLVHTEQIPEIKALLQKRGKKKKIFLGWSGLDSLSSVSPSPPHRCPAYSGPLGTSPSPFDGKDNHVATCGGRK